MTILLCCTAGIASETATLLSNVVAKGNSVRGVTSVGNQLFVVRWPSMQRIEVYDSTTFVLLRPLNVPGLNGVPQGMTSCSTNTCLYVSDGSNSVIFRIELRGNTVVTNWRVNGSPTGLSVNAGGNVIVAIRSAKYVNKLLEITTRGSLIREIHLEPGVNDVWHAVQLTDDCFVVCSNGSTDDRSLCICIVQVRTGTNKLKPADGLVRFRFGKDSPSTPTVPVVPTHLAVGRSGCIFAADRDSNRILAFNRSLTDASLVPVAVDGGLQGPCALFLDESRGRLYVGEWKGGRVLVFDNMAELSL